MPRLFLHIGYPKTGTTSLQAFFAANADGLKAHNILYPETGRIGTAHYAFNFSINLGQFERMEEVPSPQALSEALRTEARRAAIDNILLSSEYFITARNLEPVVALFEGFEVKVIVYLRRHDYAFESAFNQSVKSTVFPPWEPTIESFIVYQLGMGTIPFDYLTVLRRWADAFGEGNILVRPYEAAQNQPNIYTDFLKILNVQNVSGLTTPKAASNGSLSSDLATVIDLVQRGQLPNDLKRRVVNTLIQHDANRTTRGTTRLLSPALRAAVVARYGPSYGIIARTFLSRPDGVLFKEAAPGRGDAWSEPVPLGKQAVVEILLQAIMHRLD